MFFYTSVLIFLGIVCFGHGQELCNCGPDEYPLPKIVKVNQETHQFIDEFGRSSWFHGTNVVTKQFPFHPDLGDPSVCNNTLPSPFCDADMDYLQQLGVNVVRLGVMWQGAEPTRGTYNCTYFCEIHKIIQSLAKRNIYTLIDVHQDVLARQFCQEGVPDWFVQKDWIANENYRFPYPQAAPFTTDENGIPDPWEQCWQIGADWFLSYFSIATSDAFGKFYANHDGLLDSFAEYWTKIAQEFKNHKSVMGYNLLNEPWAGDIYENPALLIPGFADAINLFHVWEQVTTSIRQVDNETIIFFEGVTWDIQDGHPNVPGADGSKAALSYHYYAPPQLGLHPALQNRVRDHERLKTGGILTEFRMWGGSGDENVELIDTRIRDTIDATEKYLQSWIGWGFHSVVDRNPLVKKHYARTYASAVAGKLLSTGFNEDTADFYALWQVDKSVIEPTEVRLSQETYYADGYEVRITPSTWATWEEVDEGRMIKIVYTNVVVDNGNITIRINPRDPTSIKTTPLYPNSGVTHFYSSLMGWLTLFGIVWYDVYIG